MKKITVLFHEFENYQPKISKIIEYRDGFSYTYRLPSQEKSDMLLGMIDMSAVNQFGSGHSHRRGREDESFCEK